MSPSILIVDDEPAIRRLLRTSLGAQGYRLLEAQDGREALARIEQDKPDAIVLDLGLPDTDGLDLIARIRRLTAAPILVLSSRSDEQGKVQALDLGADDYITKSPSRSASRNCWRACAPRSATASNSRAAPRFSARAL